MSESAGTTELESSIAGVVRALFAPGTVDGVLQRIVDLAVETIDGCDAAGIFTRVDERAVTTSYSDELARAIDRLQVEADEGPCLQALAEGETTYAHDLVDDGRWPRFGPGAADSGIRSVLAVPISDDRPSALNLYARLPTAFGTTDRASGLLFAALAGVALGSAEDHVEVERKVDNLQAALRTRELIGQAQGILMERERITAEQAFDVLRHASQRLNVKLREVAETLVTTGEPPDPPPSGA